MRGSRVVRETTVLLVLLGACDTVTPPEPLELVATEFELCFKPDWIAIRNTDSAWKLIGVPAPPVPFGEVRVSANVSELTSMAWGSGGSAEVYHLSREELGALRCAYHSGTATARPISGTVAGIPADASFSMSYAGFGFARVGPGTFSASIQDTNATIIASYNSTGGVRADGYLLVHGFRSNGAASFPPLDFASPSVRVLDSAQLTVAQTAGEGLHLTHFLSGNTATNLDGALTSLSNTYYFALSGSQVDGDLYRLGLHSGTKELTWYYAGLSGNQSLSFGPDLSAIAATSLQTSPCMRMRAELPVQAELSSGVRVLFQVSLGRGFYNAQVFISEAFRAGANEWVAEVPEIDLPGTQCVWSPISGGTTSISATAFDGNIRLALNAHPVAGNILRSVTATRPGP